MISTRLVKYLTVCAFLGTSLFAEQAIQNNDNKEVFGPATPSKVNQENSKEELKNNVLEFEKVLKKLQEEKKTKELPLPPLNTPTAEVTDLNVIATVSINDRKYCYLLLDNNKVAKGTVGMLVKDKVIEEINENGITVSDRSRNNKTYIPVATAQITESDIFFKNRESNKNTNNR